MIRWTTYSPKAVHDQSGSRAGLTLLEMLLVLGILMMVVGFSLPAIQDAYHIREIENAGEFVRQKLSEGRARAIDTGLVYQFRYEPGKSRFVMVPDPADIAESADGSKYYRFSGEIITTMEFRKELDEAGPGEQLDPEWFEGLPDAGELAGASWSEPVEFSFEGTAKDSFVYILDEKKRSVRVDIRGLTGGVNVSRVSWEAAEE